MAADVNGNFGAFEFGFAHLRGYCPLPDEFVEFDLLVITTEAESAKISRADGFVGFLRTSVLGLKLP